MKNSKRAVRRHHVQRLKHRRRHYWGYGSPSHGYLSSCPTEMDGTQLGKVVHTPHPCSCPSCGNPRRHSWFKIERLTLQERKALDQYQEQLDEVEDQD